LFGNSPTPNFSSLGNTTVAYTQLSVLICPSDGSRKPPAAPYGTTNYVGNMGGPGVIQEMTGTIVPNGAFISGWGDSQNFGPIGIESIRDGTSNTALFSERLTGLNGAPNVRIDSVDAKRAIFNSTVGGGYHSGGAGATQFLAGCKSLPGTTLSISTYANGYVWCASYPWHVAVNSYTHFGARTRFRARILAPNISAAGSPSLARRTPRRRAVTTPAV